MNDFDRKIIENFKGKIVRKDLTCIPEIKMQFAFKGEFNE